MSKFSKMIFTLSFLCLASGPAAADVDRFHGNYCGSLLGGSGFSLAPIDALDKACKIHDQCYTRTPGSCICDRALRDAAFSVSGNAGVAPETRRKAKVIAFTMTLKPCGNVPK